MRYIIETYTKTERVAAVHDDHILGLRHPFLCVFLPVQRAQGAADPLHCSFGCWWMTLWVALLACRAPYRALQNSSQSAVRSSDILGMLSAQSQRCKDALLLIVVYPVSLSAVDRGVLQATPVDCTIWRRALTER